MLEMIYGRRFTDDLTNDDLCEMRDFRDENQVFLFVSYIGSRLCSLFCKRALQFFK